MQKDKKQLRRRISRAYRKVTEPMNELDIIYRGKVLLGNSDFDKVAEFHHISREELINKLQNKEMSIKYELLTDSILIDEVWEVESAVFTHQNLKGEITEIDLTPEDSWGE